jgi:hypothetical protein
MNCFKHRATSAIGICKSCGKGVCPDCVADTGQGLACRDSCEERVGILGRMITDNARVMKTANAQTRSTGIYGIVTGLLFLAFAGWSYTERNTFLTFFNGGVGLVLLVFGAVRLTREQYPTSNT